MRIAKRHPADTVQEITEFLLSEEPIVARKACQEYIASCCAQETEQSVLRQILIICREISNRLEHVIDNGKLLPDGIQISCAIGVDNTRMRIIPAKVPLNPSECVFLIHHQAPRYFPLIISMPTTMLFLISCFKYCLTSATSILSIFSIALLHPESMYLYSAISLSLRSTSG